MAIRSSNFSAAMVMSCANVFNNAITFVSGVVLAKYFGANDYAQLAVASQVMLLSNVIFECGLGVAYVRYGVASTTEELSSLSQNVVWLRLAILVTGLALLGVTDPLLESASARLGLTSSTLIVALVSGMLLTLWGHCRFSFQVSGRFSTYASYVLLFAVLRLFGLATLLVAGLGSNTNSAILALYAVPASLLILARFFLRRPNFSVPSLDCWKRDAVRLLRYSKYIAVSSFAYPLIASSPLFLAPAPDPIAFRADYGLALAFSSIVAPVNEAVRAVLLRRVSSIETPAEAMNLLQLYRQAAPLFGIVFLAVIGVALTFFKIYLSDQYPDAAGPIGTLLAANLAAAFLGSINSLAHFLQRPDWDMKNNLARVGVISVACVVAAGAWDAASCAVLVAAVLIAGESIVAFYVVSEIRRRRNA